MNNARRILIALAGSITVLLTGCSTAERIGMSFLYTEAPAVGIRVVLDIPYESDFEPKHRLDLFCPPGANWPVMVFVYGGGWTSGDKGLRVGGKDVYGNIGRFYAARGIGVAVINYRLQPAVNWMEQAGDVTSAIRWIEKNASSYGANSNAIFLAGHSAGAHLASMVALSPEILGGNEPLPRVKGVISISGAGLDLADQETYALGESRAYYRTRFDIGAVDWEKAASPALRIRTNAPPFLIFYAGGEKAALQRQSQLMAKALREKQISVRLIRLPSQSHRRMILALTDPATVMASEITTFVGPTQ